MKLFGGLLGLLLAAFIYATPVFAQDPYWNSKISNNDLVINNSGQLNYVSWLIRRFGSTDVGDIGPWRSSKLMEIESRVSPAVLINDAELLNGEGFDGRSFLLYSNDQEIEMEMEMSFAESENDGVALIDIARSTTDVLLMGATKTISAELQNYKQIPYASLYFVRNDYINEREADKGEDNVIRFGKGQELNNTLQEVAGATAILWDKYEYAVPQDIHNALVSGRFEKTRKINLRKSLFILKQQYPVDPRLKQK
ncbi:hypothetical protein [Pelagibaculum spongiae]|uniref:Uncharacterized protein n=1 Tax=Pelagibaculum spongiae TaxID=2080658 RepID=A0A2V1GN32_9GAMM|nr:hypothetical protein [Pelagibaculum spongiae]PVZ63428.1 hypothetical protein DC094_21200 [Pelagibaculum spongiae]